MGGMGSEESAMKDETEPLQTKNEGKFRYCACNKLEGKCKREKHKEGQSCDIMIKIGGNDRHIICKGCRSEKKKKLNVGYFDFGMPGPIVPCSYDDVIYDPEKHYAKMGQMNTYKVGSSFDHSSEPILGISKEKNKDSLKGIRIKKPKRKRGRPRKIDEIQDQQYQQDFDISGLTLGFSKGIKQYTVIVPETRQVVRYQQCNCDRSKGKCYNDNHEHGVPCGNIVKLTKNERHLVCYTCRCETKKIKDKNDAELLLSVSENLSAGSIIASLSEKLKLDSRE